ncbi:hypothetical protein REJ26_002869 [Providencia stuartii]|jgi:TM2 domain-containing membrane protein YozV|uniref:Uncharacterized protein n=5 Tax=Morganellaceae TaxID=1903414 RepID=A0A899NES8_PROST|nr:MULTISPECIES: hypothetical protein [Enterobacterales]EKH6496342.1 hypothetical protein [Providencia rettgeri]ELB1110290.1 hypothetical protein [Morganella morganii]ELL8907293.1 hypothetical protein [Proteus mirabilis]ELQ1457867.1 hypothetical protein [Providencia rettgeri]ELR5042571.1 hypothetical protein [Providencia rettgeri]
MTFKQSRELPRGAGITFMFLLFSSGVALLFGTGWLITTVMNGLDAFPYALRGFSWQWQPEPGCLTIIDAPTTFWGYLVAGGAGCITLLFICVFIGMSLLSIHTLSQVINKQLDGLDKFGIKLISRLFKK